MLMVLKRMVPMHTMNQIMMASGEGEEAGSEESWDGTTLVLGGLSPQPPLSDLDDGEGEAECEMASTDNESRSPCEVTGESAKWKALKKQRAKEGKPWPPSDTEVPGNESAVEEEENTSDDDEGLPNLPAGSSGFIDDYEHLLQCAHIVSPMPCSPSWSMSDDDHVDSEDDEHYVTPPKRAAGVKNDLKSGTKTTCPVKVKNEKVLKTKVKKERETKVKQEPMTESKEPMEHVSEDTWLKGIRKDGVGQGLWICFGFQHGTLSFAIWTCNPIQLCLVKFSSPLLFLRRISRKLLGLWGWTFLSQRSFP